VLIESDETDFVSEGSDLGQASKELMHADGVARVVALGKANTILRTYEEKELSSLDKRLLKGFYVRTTAELTDSD